MSAAAPFAAYPPRDVLWERDFGTEDELDDALEAAERSLKPLEGIHVRAVLAHNRRGGGDLLLIAIHHLVVDGVSWRVLLEDLEHALDSLADGALPALPAEACGYQGVGGRPARGRGPRRRGRLLAGAGRGLARRPHPAADRARPPTSSSSAAWSSPSTPRRPTA
ncbi:hypothetical protein GCM10020000_76510 [Streptomyces olivoverticillatus]